MVLLLILPLILLVILYLPLLLLLFQLLPPLLQVALGENLVEIREVMRVKIGLTNARNEERIICSSMMNVQVKDVR